MLQRSCGGDGKVFRSGKAELLQGIRRPSQVSAPNVAPFDNACRQSLPRQCLHKFRIRYRGSLQVEVDCFDGRFRKGRSGLSAVAVGERHQDLGPVGDFAKPVPNLLGNSHQFVPRSVEVIRRQSGFVKLNPLHARFLEIIENLSVGLGEGFKKFEGTPPFGASLLGLRKRQESDGTNQGWTDGEPLVAGPNPLGDLGLVSKLESRFRGEFRDQIVVVRVEPLGHLKRANLVRSASLRKVKIQPFKVFVAGRFHSQGHGGVQDLVV